VQRRAFIFTYSYENTTISRRVKKKGQNSTLEIVKALNFDYHISIVQLCRYFSIHRSRYYYWLKSQNSDKTLKENDLKRRIVAIYTNSEYIYGYRRIHIDLAIELQRKVNHKLVHRLCKVLDIKSIIRVKKRKGYKEARKQISENILAQNFYASAPNQKWVTDITETKVNNDKAYICVIQDLFNREIVSYGVSKHANTELVYKTMQTLFAKHKEAKDVIIHSDQGVQFTAKRIKKLIKRNGFKASNSRAGNCLDNAVVENFFSHYKSELIYLNNIQTYKELVDRTNKYMYFYNNERRQIKTKMTPVEIREQYYNNN